NSVRGDVEALDGYGVTGSGQTHRSNDLAHLVLENGLEDVPAVLLAAGKRFGKVQRLLRRDLAGKRGLVRVDHRLNDGGAPLCNRVLQDIPGVFGSFDREAGRAAGLGVGLEVDWLQLDAVLGI